MRDWFTEKNGGEDLIHKGASSRKLKMQTKMVGVIKASLKQHDSKAYEMFNKERHSHGKSLLIYDSYLIKWRHTKQFCIRK